MQEKMCKHCGFVIQEKDKAFQKKSYGLTFRNECKPCRSKLSVIHKRKDEEEKKTPCETCSFMCIKKFSRTFCSLKCRLFGSINKVENGCWEWTGKIGEDGYSRLKINGRETRGHRVSFELYREPIKSGMVIRHLCHVPKCINPDHLIPGTVSENSIDMIKAKRSLQGTKHHNVKLSEENIAEIKELYKSGMTQDDIAKKFEVTQVNISCIVLGKSWRHLNSEK